MIASAAFPAKTTESARRFSFSCFSRQGFWYLCTKGFLTLYFVYNWVFSGLLVFYIQLGFGPFLLVLYVRPKSSEGQGSFTNTKKHFHAGVILFISHNFTLQCGKLKES